MNSHSSALVSTKSEIILSSQGDWAIFAGRKKLVGCFLHEMLSGSVWPPHITDRSCVWMSWFTKYKMSGTYTSIKDVSLVIAKYLHWHQHHAGPTNQVSSFRLMHARRHILLWQIEQKRFSKINEEASLIIVPVPLVNNQSRPPSLIDRVA